MLPHWLNARKLWKHSKTMSMRLKFSLEAAVLQPIHAKVESASACWPRGSPDALVDPGPSADRAASRASCRRSNDLRGRGPEAQHRVESFAELSGLARDLAPLRSDMKVPVEVD